MFACMTCIRVCMCLVLRNLSSPSIPPGRDEYFLVNLGSMSAKESTHRACLHHKMSLCDLRQKCFFVVKSPHPRREEVCIHIRKCTP